MQVASSLELKPMEQEMLEKMIASKIEQKEIEASSRLAAVVDERITHAGKTSFVQMGATIAKHAARLAQHKIINADLMPSMPGVPFSALGCLIGKMLDELRAVRIDMKHEHADGADDECNTPLTKQIEAMDKAYRILAENLTVQHNNLDMHGRSLGGTNRAVRQAEVVLETLGHQIRAVASAFKTQVDDLNQKLEKEVAINHDLHNRVLKLEALLPLEYP